MKKALKIATLFLLILFIGACSQKEVTQEEKDLKKIESLGLSKEEAKNYFGYVNSLRLGFKALDDINKNIEGESFVIPENEYNTVIVSFNLADEYSSKLPLGKDSISFDDILKEPSVSPEKIMNNIQQHKRNIGVGEINLLLGMIDHYTDNMVTLFDVSDSNKNDLFKYYVDSLKLQSSFKNVQEKLLEDTDFNNL